MQNAMNTNLNGMERKAEKQGEKLAEKASSVIDRGVAELKSWRDTDINAVASDLSKKARDVSSDVYSSSLSFVRKNPVGSAIGLAAVGFFAGLLAARRK